MSGGHFEYKQLALLDMASAIDELIKEGEYPEDILQKFETGSLMVKLAYVFVQRIDWLVCGNDGEDTFRKRLDDDFCDLFPDSD